MLGYSVAQYLSRFQIQTPLWGQKLIPLLDYTFSNNYKDNKELSSPFYQIVNKYLNTTELPLQSLEYYVKEMGYNYILDFFKPDEAGAQRLVSFLVLIHLLKGSRKGLELVLNIMGISGTMVEWYETKPLGVADTFTLYIDPETLTDSTNPQTYKNFEIFVRNYVYPEVKFVIIYHAYMNYAMYSDLQGTMRVKYRGYIKSDIGVNIDQTINMNLIEAIKDTTLYSLVSKVPKISLLFSVLNLSSKWKLTDCYLDVYDRLIPSSNQIYSNIGTWENSGQYYGINGIYGEECVSTAFAESPIFDVGSVQGIRLILSYHKLIFDSSSILIQWRTSADNITWSEYSEYNGLTTSLRYYQIKLTFKCNSNRLAILLP